MERSIKLTLEKAKEFYKKGGEFKDLALSAFSREELTKVELPKTWEDFCESHARQKEESLIDESSNVVVLISSKEAERDFHLDRNVLLSKTAAEAHLALMQLHQLRDCYRQGWIPEYSDNLGKYCISRYNNNDYKIDVYFCTNAFLSFQTIELAKEFLNNFKDLIIKAGDLI